MVKALYRKFNLEEATELLDETRDMIVRYHNDHTIDHHHFHSLAEYVGYNLFVLFADKGLISCAEDRQMDFDMYREVCDVAQKEKSQ